MNRSNPAYPMWKNNGTHMNGYNNNADGNRVNSLPPQNYVQQVDQNQNYQVERAGNSDASQHQMQENFQNQDDGPKQFQRQLPLPHQF